MPRGIHVGQNSITFWTGSSGSYRNRGNLSSSFSSSNPQLKYQGWRGEVEGATGSFSGSSVTFGTASVTDGTHSFLPYTESNGSQSTFLWAWPNAWPQWETKVSAASMSAFIYSASTFPQQQTASFILTKDSNDDFRIYSTSSFGSDIIDSQFNNPSASWDLGAINKNYMYISSSGKMGFLTTTPTDDIDFKANSIKFRSDDGVNEVEFTDGKWITKKFAGAEGAETSGSEIVLTYSPGEFGDESIAQVGDMLGSIVWEDLSIGDRDGATAMSIKGRVAAKAGDGTSIRGEMGFYISSEDEIGLGSEYFRIGQANVSAINSVLQVSQSYFWIGNQTTDTDRYIKFDNSTSGKRWIIGVDENQSVFSIHQGSTFVSTNDFELSDGGTLRIAGELTAAGLGTTPIDGGTF